MFFFFCLEVLYFRNNQNASYNFLLTGPEILLKSEWREKIDEYLEEQLKIEKGLASCLIIQNCNSNSDKVRRILFLLYFDHRHRSIVNF